MCQVGEKIAKEFNDAVPAYPGLVTAMTLDLADLDSVRAFAKKFGEEREKLHILINNAGIMHTPEGKTKQGEREQATRCRHHTVRRVQYAVAMMVTKGH